MESHVSDKHFTCLISPKHLRPASHNNGQVLDDIRRRSNFRRRPGDNDYRNQAESTANATEYDPLFDKNAQKHSMIGIDEQIFMPGRVKDQVHTVSLFHAF